jgi:hypothetical protein
MLLAAAIAECGEFEKASAIMKKLISNVNWTEQSRKRLESLKSLFDSKRPYRREFQEDRDS